MNNQERQKRLELNQIFPLLRELGLQLNDDYCNDKPDICIPLSDNYLVGIEVTQYGKGDLDQAQSAFYDVLQEYAQRIDTESPIRYHASVCPHGMAIQSDIKYKKVKDVIFEELDRFRLGIEPDYSKEHYIDYADFTKVDFLEKSFLGLSSAIEYGEVNTKQLLKRIDEKNAKLNKYKKLSKNSEIKEYWLAIYFDLKEAADITHIHTPANINSDYDRIYLCDNTYCVRIK